MTKNVVFLKNFITNPLIKVGDYTYYDGHGNIEEFETENVLFCRTCSLTISKFCQLAFGTIFLMGDANHHMKGVSTFPFFIFGMWNMACPEWNHNIPEETKGDTFIGNDVWFGRECTIIPGVTIEKLLKIQWWNWDYMTITKHIPNILSSNIETLEKVRTST